MRAAHRFLRAVPALLALALAVHEAPAAPLAHVEQQVYLPTGAVTVRVPEGLRLEILIAGLDKPRLGAVAPDGALVLGSRSGAVYRIEPPYYDPAVMVRLDDYPHSVAFRGDEMLIARTGGLYRARYPGAATLDPAGLTLIAPLPGGRGHDSRTVGIGPGGAVHVSIGIRGNCSDEYLAPSYPAEARRGGVLRLVEAPVVAWEPFATGLRNPVGFAFHPETGVAYATNNGPDHLGFEQPQEVFARLDPGSFHGMPWFWTEADGRAVRDVCARSEPPRPAAEVAPPEARFPARSAPMAVAFVPDGALDGALDGHAVVALRGSWATRSHGDGGGDPATRREPKLVLVRFEDGRPAGVEDLVTGFQDASGARWARPVGLVFGPDGALYFTSDEGLEALMRLVPDR